MPVMEMTVPTALSCMICRGLNGQRSGEATLRDARPVKLVFWRRRIDLCRVANFPHLHHAMNLSQLGACE